MLSTEVDKYREAREQRTVVIPVILNATAEISSKPTDGLSFPVEINACKYGKGAKDTYHVKPIDQVIVGDDAVYNIPFMFNADGTPWNEGNQYIFHLASQIADLGTNTTDIRRKASRLLDYKIFCEDKGLDYLDFSGRRQIHRPTYKYYNHLSVNGIIGPANINQRTGVVYQFYKWLSKETGYDIDIRRVDKVTDFKLSVATRSGSMVLSKEKRSQTKPVNREPKPVAMGYVRDEGEELRPLTQEQTNVFLKTIRPNLTESGTLKHSPFYVDEQLMCMIALTTGARKQSIFTLRAKHIQTLQNSKVRNDGTIELFAGPGTGIDTKFNKKHVYYLPEMLVEELIVYYNSSFAFERRGKFKEDFIDTYSDLPLMPEEDMYVFLSDQGKCRYMAKDDPRYPRVKSVPTGQCTNALKNKLMKFLPEKFPKDFTFHWLRATFALQYYNWLLPLVEAGQMTPVDQLNSVRRRMHHVDLSTTEHYLKLFANINDLKMAQEGFEERLFNPFDIAWSHKIRNQKRVV